MKFFPLLMANLLRKKIRTALTLGSFAVALFLFGLLAIVQAAFSQGADASGADRLVVINRVSIIQSLPISYKDRMLRIPGVKLVTHQNWFGGVYQDERNFFARYANDDETFRAMYPELAVSDPEWQAYMADRQGALAGEALAKRFHWKLGDRIPLKGTIFAGAWEFNLRGIYHGRPQDDTSSFFFHYKYLEERENPYWKGLVGFYEVQVANPEDAGKVAKRIDQEFANSPWETKSDTEKSFLASFMRQTGNIAFLIRSIGAVVFFTLLLISGNTMAIAVRERVRELAVLKAIGFSDVFVLLLVLAEVVLVALLGGAIGLALIKWVSLSMGALTSGLVLAVFYLPSQAIVAGVGMALLVGLAAGILPALAAMRLNVVDSMRRV
jgi:putative ABC transport system permease protein